MLVQKTDQIGDLDAKIQEKTKKQKELQAQNRETEARILTKKQVMELPVKDQLELFKLRKLKEVVVKLVDRFTKNATSGMLYD